MGFNFDDNNDDFAFSQSDKANIGITQVTRVDTATIVVSSDGTGDFETIQEAINSIKTQGGYIQVKEGIYNIKSTILIHENISIRGTGNKTVILGDGIITNLIELTGDNIEISNLSIKGTETGGVGSTEVGILIDSLILNLTISNCEFQKLGFGIKLKADSSTVNNNIFRKTYTGIFLTESNGATSINNNLFDYEVAGNTAIESGGVNFMSIIGNTGFVNIGYTGHLSDYNINLSSNNFTEQGDITFPGDQSNISGNVFNNLTISGDNNTISSNKSSGNVTNTGTNNTTIILKGGDIGINETSPQAKLHITGTSADLLLLDNSAQGYDNYSFRFNTGSGLTFFNATDSRDELRFRGNGDILVCELIGGFGIGVGTTSSLLEVAGAIATAISTKTAYYTALISDSTILGDATSGAITITLPTAVGINGRQYVIKKIDSSSNAITVDGDGTETIDGATTFDLYQNEVIKVQSDGSNWWII